MTVEEDVHNYLTKIAPKAVCDDCLTRRLPLSVRQHANHKTRELANEPGFRRGDGHCDFCHDVKRVIRWAGRGVG